MKDIIKEILSKRNSWTFGVEIFQQERRFKEGNAMDISLLGILKYFFLPIIQKEIFKQRKEGLGFEAIP